MTETLLCVHIDKRCRSCLKTEVGLFGEKIKAVTPKCRACEQYVDTQNHRRFIQKAP